jgi:hypothetical protein
MISAINLPGQRKGLLLPPPCPPPKGFIQLTADNDTLRSHGLPLRPSKDIFPRRYAQWERLMSRQLSFIAPEYVVVEKDSTDTTGPLVTAKIDGDISKDHGTSKKWSGAVNTTLANDDMINHIEASWTFPGVFPAPDKWETATTWNKDPSKYACGIWVGIDGYENSKDILQAGTAMKCTVDEKGNLQQESFAWFEWYPHDVYQLTEFKVQAGDVITVLVDYVGVNEDDDDASSNSTEEASSIATDDAGSNATNDTTDHTTEVYTAHAVFANESNSTYTSFTYKCTFDSDDNKFQGNTAEWILERHTKNDDAMPNFGATFMYNCLATTTKNDDGDLDK